MKQKEIFELEPLFSDVQLQQVFADGKTFVDCTPKENTGLILAKYQQLKNTDGFSLPGFVQEHFELPKLFAGDYTPEPGITTAQHINNLWDILTREPDTQKGSLIPLPNAYIVPGGRFGEVYYWDSYFTMLGLKVSGRVQMIENMVKNFAHLIDTVGFIPNGNRTYYLGRSQPPFYSLMVLLLASVKGNDVLQQYLPTLQKEYTYWMKGSNALSGNQPAIHHVVKLGDGEVLNRYCDAFDTARPESYREDTELIHQSKQAAASLFMHLRAGAESGWDYSSRWFKDGKTFATIQTADIIPVDLNCLLYNLEYTIARAHKTGANEREYSFYFERAERRKQAIEKYCWNITSGYYNDYDWKNKRLTEKPTLAGMAPFFFSIAPAEHIATAAAMIEKDFLKDGGVITTLQHSGQQWDAPNGWAPLQWMTVVGLKNYEYDSLAATIAQRWLALNDKVFAATGKMMEKYNVEDISRLAGGGEYPGQDGFGWTNGVYLALKEMYPG